MTNEASLRYESSMHYLTRLRIQFGDYKEEEEEFGKEKAAMTRSGTVVHHSQRE